MKTLNQIIKEVKAIYSDDSPIDMALSEEKAEEQILEKKHELAVAETVFKALTEKK